MMLQLYLFFSYFMDGFAYAGEALGGRFYGARNGEAFRDTLRRLFGWMTIVTTAYTLLYIVVIIIFNLQLSIFNYNLILMPATIERLWLSSPTSIPCPMTFEVMVNSGSLPRYLVSVNTLLA